MEVTFWTKIHVCHRASEFSNLVFFFSVDLSESIYIFAFGPTSSHNSFPMLLIHSALLFSWLSYFAPKLFCFFVTSFGISSCFSPYLLFEYFFVILECPVLSIFFLVFLLSPVPSSLFPWVVLSVLLMLLFSLFSQQTPMFLLCFFIFACCRFLICVPVEFPNHVLSFCSCLLWKPRFFHRLILFLNKFDRLIPKCFSLRYMLIPLFFSVSAETVF